MTPQHANDDLAARRRRAVRTALVVGAIALLVYVGFILSGVLGSANASGTGHAAPECAQGKEERGNLCR